MGENNGNAAHAKIKGCSRIASGNQNSQDTGFLLTGKRELKTSRENVEKNLKVKQSQRCYSQI